MNTPDLIPRTVLFGGPSVLYPALAPTGDRLAYLAPRSGVPNLWLRHLDGDPEPVPLTRDTDRGIPEFAWSRDGRYLIYLNDVDGDERDHLYAVDVTDGGTRDLTPPGVSRIRIVGFVASGPWDLLVGLNNRESRLHDVYRLRVDTGQFELDAVNDGFGGWVSAGDTVKGAMAPDTDGGAVLMIRDGRRGWRPLRRIPPDDVTTTRAVTFDPDGRTLWLISSIDSDTARLVRTETATGKTSLVYADPDYDVTGVSIDPRTRTPDAVIVQREREYIEGLTPLTRSRIDMLRDRCDGTPRIVGRDRNDERWFVQEISGHTPTTYHLADWRDGTMDLLLHAQPELERYTPAPVEPFSFRARDGLVLHGYLTFPVNRRTRVPAVLAVHGGPWSRDLWGLRGESQWLANRGYLCVQVNYRGSTGYGKGFTNAGDQEWGGRMQDDLTDAVGWAVERGFADPERMAIYGSSYGGYAALCGAAFTPDLYRCAIAHAAPCDLRTFIRSTPAYDGVNAARLLRRVGDPDAQSDLLWSRSPLSRVDQIKIPLLIAHGERDPRVSRDEPEQLVAALRDRGIPHQYLSFPDEGHAFTRPRNRLAFYAACERFLAEHLGGRYEA